MAEQSFPQSNGIRGSQGIPSMTAAVLSWLAVALLMGLIFLLSAQTADQSGRLSGGVTQFLLSVVGWIFPSIAADPEIFHHLVRKSAHFLAYLMLGMLTANACRKSGVAGLRMMSFALVICILYAASDEIHQLYIPGRGAAVTDVFIDSAGAVVGILLHQLATRCFQGE